MRVSAGFAVPTAEDCALDRLISRYERASTAPVFASAGSTAAASAASAAAPSEQSAFGAEDVVEERQSHHHQDQEQRGPDVSAAAAAAQQIGAHGNDAFVSHKVTPADTLGGLELRYGVCASDIRRANGMTSDRLTSHLLLRIPKSAIRRRGTNLAPTLVADARTERMQILRLFRARFRGICDKEVDYYLAAANGSVGLALGACQLDHDWERSRAAAALRARASDRDARTDGCDAQTDGRDAKADGDPTRRQTSGVLATLAAWLIGSSSSSSSSSGGASGKGSGCGIGGRRVRDDSVRSLKEKQLQMVRLRASDPAAYDQLDADHGDSAAAVSLLSRDYAALELHARN